jgi:hypothetical protein
MFGGCAARPRKRGNVRSDRAEQKGRAVLTAQLPNIRTVWDKVLRRNDVIN